MSISALQSLELIERLHAYDSVAPPAMAAPQASWVGTSVGVAGVPLLIGGGELEEIIETPPITAIPGTKAWVLGVAAYKGGFLPIFSGDVLFRKRPYIGRARDYCMVIRRPGLYFGLTLSHIQRDLRFPLTARVVDHAVDPDFTGYTSGGFMYKGEFLAVLDMEKLVGDEELSNASAGKSFSTKGKGNE
jgi:twitching motility protein PilI